MKKSLALALALIMVMGCMSFAAADGERTVTLTTPSAGISNVTGEGSTGTVELTYFVDETNGASWTNGADGSKFIQVSATISAPNNARYIELVRPSDNYSYGISPLRNGDSNTFYYDYNHGFNENETSQQLTLKWYDTNDENKNLLYTDDFTCTLILTGEKPAKADRIKVSGSNATISDGSVAFDAVPAEGTAITVSKPNEYASSYQIDGGSITSGTSANINIGDLSAGASQDYTIKWYSGENFLVGTDTLTVSVRPKDYYSFAAYKTTVVIEEPNGTQAKITPKDGFLPDTSVELKYELTEEQWEEAFYNWGEDNGIYLTASFTLPEGAEKYYKALYGADAKDEDCMKILRGAESMDKGRSFGAGLRIAGQRMMEITS